MLVIALAVGILVFRVQKKQKEIENELRAAIQLELNALITGDRDLFISRQNPDNERWQRVQEEAFDLYHWPQRGVPWQVALPVPRYTGEIPLAHVGQDEGWAEVIDMTSKRAG